MEYLKKRFRLKINMFLIVNILNIPGIFFRRDSSRHRTELQNWLCRKGGSENSRGNR